MPDSDLTQPGPGGEVVELFRGEQVDHDAPVRDKPRDPEKRFCRHMRVELDDGARRVYCRDCGEEVPAFDFLKMLSGEWERFTNAREEAKRLAVRAREREEDAKRQEQNTKSRLRRAMGKMAEGDPMYDALLKLTTGPRLIVSKSHLLAILKGDFPGAPDG